MSTFNPVHSDFVSTVAARCRDGVTALSAAFLDAQVYSLLGYAPDGADPITTDDLAGDNAGLTPADVAAAVQTIGQIQAVLAADSSAGLKALLRLARHAR